MNVEKMRDEYGLTRTECKILESVGESGVALRAVLFNKVWGYPEDVAAKMKSSRAMDMAVSRLKRKLAGAVTIESLRGRGYKLTPTMPEGG